MWPDPERVESQIFEPLRVHGGAVLDLAWPAMEDFERALAAREPPVRVASGRALALVRQGPKPLTFEDRYEARLYLRGELQVREADQHDHFNVLVWLAFPRAKAALNARHYEALRARAEAGAANRGPAQDALTLFDESGVVIASSDAGLAGMLQEWRWKDLFWANRGRLASRLQLFLFGHAAYQKMLRPFLGITCRGIVLDVEAGLLSAPLPQRLAEIDARVAAHVADPARMLATRELAVVPVLGYPGWHPDNGNEGFYDNTE